MNRRVFAALLAVSLVDCTTGAKADLGVGAAGFLASLQGDDARIIDPAGRGTRRFLSFPGMSYAGVVHPRQERVAASTDEGILIAGFDGKVILRIQQLVEVKDLAWSLDGRHLAGVGRELPAGRMGLLSVDLETKEVTLVSATGREPAWRPGTDELTYVEGSRILRWDPVFRRQAECLPGTEPSWSPDGARMTFRDPKGDIWLGDSTCRAVSRLVSGKGIVSVPRWSLDGRLVAFLRRVDHTSSLLECLEPRLVVLHRVEDGVEAAIDQVCKADLVDFHWVDPAVAKSLSGHGQSGGEWTLRPGAMAWARP